MVAKFCTNCGAPAEAGAVFCAKCGSRLTPGIPPASAPGAAPSYPAPPVAPPTYAPPPAYPTYPYPAPAYGRPTYPYPAMGPPVDFAAMERNRQIGRTRLGVLFLAVGFLVGWIPIIGLVSFPLDLIGAILVIIGRKPFGHRHSLYVLISVLTFFVGIAVLGVALIETILAESVAVSAGDLPAAVAAVRNGVTWSLVGNAIVAIAYVLFVHELEDPIGRYLLYAAYAATLATGGALVALTASALGAPSLTFADLAAFEAQLEAWRVIAGVQGMIFAGAYYIAYSRIQRKEIPAPSGPAPTVSAVWTAPAPIPPPAPPPSAPAAPTVPPEAPPPPPPASPPDL